MKRSSKYQLGGKEFSSKEQIASAAQKILWETEPGVFFDKETAEYAFLLDLLAWHPEAAEKIGNGVNRFRVEITNFFRGAGRGDRQFMVCRVDNSEDNFSYRKCIDGNSERGKKMEAFRNAIRPQIDEERKAKIYEAGMNPADYDIHHEVALSELVQRFLRAKRLRFREIALKGSESGGFCEELADMKLRTEWEKYHKAEARLAVIAKAEHRKMPTRAIGELAEAARG